MRKSTEEKKTMLLSMRISPARRNQLIQLSNASHMTISRYLDILISSVYSRVFGGNENENKETNFNDII